MAKKRRDDDDEEGGEEEEELEDEDVDAGDQRSKKRKKGSRAVAEEDAEEEEEDDDDDEDDEGGGGASRKKKKRNVFIDDIADVDDDDEEEEDDEEAEDLIDDKDVEIPDEPNAGAQHAAYRRLNREREEKSAEEIARQVEERYKRMEEGAYGYDDGAALAQTGAVGQQAMQPTVNDPKLWLIQCRPGHERELVTQLLQKYYTMGQQGTPLLIKSAITLDHLKGYVYVEAEKEAHVRDAIKGLRTVFMSKGVKLVPLDQMVEAITVNRQAKMDLAPNSWVRVRTGVYKDDLAKVINLDRATQKVTVWLIPRLDLQGMADRAKDPEMRKRNPFGRAGPVRPAAKPFNQDEAKQLALSVTKQQGYNGQTYLMLGSNRFVNGYIEREFATNKLTIIEGVPPLEELQRFNQVGAAADETSAWGGGSSGAGSAATMGDLSALMANLPSGGALPKTQFVKGDVVDIVRGDLQGIKGVVDAVRDDGKVMVKPKDVDGFDESVDFDNEDLRKFFSVGDRVRLISGPNTGDIGIVLQWSPDSDQAIIISDSTRQEIKTFGRDMSSTDLSDTGVEVLGEYHLHDLVQLDQHTAGVIISIQRDSARVLTTSSTADAADIRPVRAADIQRKLKSKDLMASDAGNNTVRVGDYVTILPATNGQRAAKDTRGGTVEYVWRGQLFLKAKEFLDTGGFLCVRANKCKVRGGAGPASGVELARQVAAGGFARGRVGASPAAYGSGGATSSFAYMPASPSQYAGNNARAAAGSLVPPSPSRGGGGPGAAFKPPPPRMGPPPPGSFSGASGGGGGHGGGRNGSTLVNRVVKVVGGQYNGYRGRVKHETGTHVQLELEAISGRVVTVPKNLVRDVAATAASGAFGGAGPAGAAGAGGYSGAARGVGSAPEYGTRTPLHPSQTPLHPSMTPAHYSMGGGATPAHAPYTPMHAPTPMDDSYNYTRPGDRDDHLPAVAHTPGIGGTAYTPAAYTPSAPTPSAYGGDPHHAPTPAIQDPGTVGPPPVAGTPGLAPTPMIPGTAAAPTPYVPAFTPAITPGVAATPGLDGLLGATPGVAPTPHVNTAYTPHLVAATPHLPAATPALDDPLAPQYLPTDHLHAWGGVLVLLPPPGAPPGAPPGDAWPVAEVLEPSLVAGGGPTALRVVRGSLRGGEFARAPGAPVEEADGHAVHLVRPSKQDWVKVLATDDLQQVGRVGRLTAVVNDPASGTENAIVRFSQSESCFPQLMHLGKMAAPPTA